MNINNFDPKKTIFLIDGSNFLYRAYYSMRPLFTAKGVAVQAVYNFCRMIKKVINTFEPENMVLTWDSKGKTERHELFQDYKAGRQAPPSDLFTQKDLIIEFSNLIELAQSQMTGVEADDIINSLTQDYKNKGFTVVIIASDKDLYQLIDKDVFVYDPFKEELTDVAKFEQKMEFAVGKLPFYFALLGDTSDNIPGVKGIGKTGATQLVNQFASMDDMYNNLDKISREKLRNLLQESKDKAYLSLNLFLPRYHKIELTEQQVKFHPNNWINARPLFEELEFKSLLKELEVVIQPDENSPFFADEKGYKFKGIVNKSELDELCLYLKEKKVFAVDTETDGLDPLRANMIGFSVCAEKGLAYYIPVAHNKTAIENQIPKEEIIATIKPIFEDQSIKKYLHNAKFDQLVFYQAGINLKGVSFDTMIAANLIVEDWQRIALKYLSQYYLSERMYTFEEVVKNKKLKDFSYVPLAEAVNYAAADAHQTFVLKEILDNKLKELNLVKVFSQVEMPLSDILFKMEAEGIYIDLEILKDIDLRLTESIRQIENEIQDVVKSEQPLNLNSPKQIEDLLFNKLKLPPQKKSAKRTGYSTDQTVLEELALMHPVPQLLLKYRELYKLKSTYVDALPGYVNPTTKKVHTTFSLTSTATGRLSSFNPNLQNIPTDGSGYEIRSIFKPEAGHIFLSADYSQIELRVLAFLSQDQNLIDSFLKGEDIHTKTSSYLFDVPLNEVTNSQRQVGKRINFSIMYGLTPFGLSKDLKIPFKEAKIYIDKYFTQYPGVSAWMEKTIQHAKEKGYVETYFGRRRFIPGINEKNRTLYELSRRLAINTPAQGTAAEIMKLGMINLTKEFDLHKFGAKILVQIHDELIISVPLEQQAKVEKLTKTILESVIMTNVPFVVTTRFGQNWQEVTK